MPGVIMENGSGNGSRTNHDRDQWLNGVNGASNGVDKVLDKGKARTEPHLNTTPRSPPIPNGVNGSFARDSQQPNGEETTSQSTQNRMDQLPTEIQHLTVGYRPLSMLLSRLAQKTHNDLSATILEMAQMPTPTSAINGNASHITSVDDNSVDNINKKLRLLKFSQDAHAEWTKALIVTSWSQKSDDVSRMIDLNLHLNEKRAYYDQAIYSLGELKRGLIHARIPNPDLKTALEVLTTGKASWMPELGYIKPTPLTAKEILKSLENLNTLLSIRLNLHEYDDMPLQFKDYTIQSGRVTFRVAGEFEIDLTIADEDPEAQFWFIDFRFTFWPSLSDLTPLLRSHIEDGVNSSLLRSGLSGCYKHLHELVLTHKISEFRRQAVELSRGKWVEGLKVEILNRAVCIQYWLDRYGNKGPKSWIIMGIHSGRSRDGRHGARPTSRLFIRWFRDSKEVNADDITFDTVNISAEDLLKTVVAKHVTQILASVYQNLSSKPLFAHHEAAISLSTSADEPAESELQVQLTHSVHASIRIEPVTGRFVLAPTTTRTIEFAYMLNNRCPNPAADGHHLIEQLRYKLVEDEIMTLGLSVGWRRLNNPGVLPIDLKAVLPKDTVQIMWFQRSGWVKDWFVVLCLSMSGERWWLVETANTNTGVKLMSNFRMPINAACPRPSYSFLSSINVFAAALVSHYTNLRALYNRKALHMLRNPSKLSKGISIPSIYVRLSEILPSKNTSARTGKPWAKDIVKLSFHSLEVVPRRLLDAAIIPQTPLDHDSKADFSAVQAQKRPSTQSAVFSDEVAIMVTEARMVVPLPQSLASINEMVDKDIAFHAETGSFAFRLRSKVGEPVIPSLIERAVRVQHLVEFVQVLQRHEMNLKCETISLGKITFRYGKSLASNLYEGGMDLETSPWLYKAVVDFAATDDIKIVLERGNPHLRILDLFTRVLNNGQGLDGVATLLPLTLPVLRAFDSLEEAWAPLCDDGEAYIFVRASEWYCIRYNLFIHVPDSIAPPTIRKIMFEVRLRQRKGASWWYVRRTDIREKDDLDAALAAIWNSSGSGWQGMRLSGVAQSGGIGDLLAKIDETVRNEASKRGMVEASSSSQAQIQAPAVPHQPRPNGNQRLQQPAPNQSQNQGRSNSLKMEVVEID